MTRKEFEKIGKNLICHLPKEFMVNRNLVFIQPIGHLLRGICFQGSIDKRAFYVWKFVQPLFIPAEGVWLNFGDRLIGGCHTWNADDPDLYQSLLQAIEKEALPYIISIKTLEDMLNYLTALNSEEAPIIKQTIFFILARMGRIPEACESIDQFINYMSLSINACYWKEKMQRALSLKSLLIKDPEAAQKQLDEWEAYTVKNIKLEKYI